MNPTGSEQIGIPNASHSDESKESKESRTVSVLSVGKSNLPELTPLKLTTILYQHINSNICTECNTAFPHRNDYDRHMQEKQQSERKLNVW